MTRCGLLITVGLLVLLMSAHASGQDAEVSHVYIAPGMGYGPGPYIAGKIRSVTIEGVTLVELADGGASRVVTIPWYAVQQNADGWRVPERYESIANDSNAGYRRRMRGDLTGCGDIYESLAPELIGSDSEMAVEIFGGLLEDAVIRSDYLDAAISGAVFEEIGDTNRLTKAHGIKIDSRYGVRPGVPMVPSLNIGERLLSLEEQLALNSPGSLAIITGFRLVSEAGFDKRIEDVIAMSEERKLSDARNRLGIELYMKMLAAQKHAEDSARSDARDWLRARISGKSGTWVEVWCRLAIGVSYLNEAKAEPDESTKNLFCSRGVVELLHVLHTEEDMYSGLRRAALGYATDGLRSLSRFREAGVLQESFAFGSND